MSRNIITSTPDAIELLNLDQIEAGSAKRIKIRIGYATFYLVWKDLDKLKHKLAEQNVPSRDLLLGKCYFTLSAEGCCLLMTLVRQAVNAKAAYERRQQREEEERLRRKRLEEEWRNWL
jgi:hypothetical protein